MTQERRTVILHYHLFKNAGTSLDKILIRNFGAAWVTREFKNKPGGNGDLVAEWIGAEHEAIAFSSHTMRGPVINPRDIDIIPILFLRDPIARIKSAYSFERQQQADTLGNRLARAHDFRGYCLAQLEIPNHRQCRDFHVDILAAMSPGPESELERAKLTVSGLRETGVVGLVENFDGALSQLASRLSSISQDFHWESVRANTSKDRQKVELDEDLEQLLREVNQSDLELLEWVRKSANVP